MWVFVLHCCIFLHYVFLHFFFLLMLSVVFFFFFSSRRRHTRLVSDWSSDVCSSDLSPGFAAIIRQILREKRLKKIFVPGSFSLGLARELRRLRIKVKIRSGCFFPEREFKHADEVKKISAALMMAEVGLAEGIQALKNAKIGRNARLLYHNVPLTSEKLRAIIDIAIIQAGGLAAHTIVAGGKQACDPHERGHGILRAHEPIIIDVFPRSQKTGYYGDITRTVVKGRASQAVHQLYQT